MQSIVPNKSLWSGKWKLRASLPVQGMEEQHTGVLSNSNIWVLLKMQQPQTGDSSSRAVWATLLAYEGRAQALKPSLCVYCSLLFTSSHTEGLWALVCFFLLPQFVRSSSAHGVRIIWHLSCFGDDKWIQEIVSTPWSWAQSNTVVHAGNPIFEVEAGESRVPSQVLAM